jgi:hypothetical protein
MAPVETVLIASATASALSLALLVFDRQLEGSLGRLLVRIVEVLVRLAGLHRRNRL